METCGTCAHFEADEGARLGSCRRWHIGYGVVLSDVKDNEVLVEDDEGWGMTMGRQFGCVLWSPSPQQQEMK